MTSAASMTVKLPAPPPRGGFCVGVLHAQQALREFARWKPVCLPKNPCSCAAPAQVVSSFCDGNTMGPHIIGDMVCLLLALAQVPWLCGPLCSLWGQVACAGWLVTQVRQWRVSDDFGVC